MVLTLSQLEGLLLEVETVVALRDPVPKLFWHFWLLGLSLDEKTHLFEELEGKVVRVYVVVLVEKIKAFLLL